jgi:hypothetical protein
MANNYVQVPPNSTGVKMQTFENTVGGNVVDAEAVTLVRSSDNTEIGTSGQPLRVDPTGTTSQPTNLHGNAGAILDGATGASVPANAIQVGDRAATALPTAVANAQLVAPMTDKYGRQVVVLGTIRDLVGFASVQTTDTGAHNLLASGGADIFTDLISLAITNETATATVVSLSDGTVTYKFALAANGGIVNQWNATLPATSAATAWTVTSSATVTLNFVVTYCKNK